MRERIIKIAIIILALLAAAGLIAIGFSSGAFDGISCSGGGDAVDESLPLVPKMPVKGQLSVYFIDVGQGNAALLVSPGGKTMLIDAGESIYASRVEKFIKQIDIKSLDVVIGTHSHSDHIGAMPRIIRDLKVSSYYTTALNVESVYSASVDAALEEKGVNSSPLWSGDSVPWDENCSVTVLSPVIGCEYSKTDANDGCLMLRIEYGETALLITADATAHAEQLSMFHNERELFEANLLLVAHHGSTTSSTLGFIETVGGETAVISVGAKNPYGHPDFDILNRLKGAGYTVLRTDELGSIAAFSDGKTLELAFQKPKE